MVIETEEVEGKLRGPRQLEQALTVVPTKGLKPISFIKCTETLSPPQLVLNSPRFLSPSLALFSLFLPPMLSYSYFGFLLLFSYSFSFSLHKS
ncbi:hypothetical protein QQF64_022340 [Cirrhinus molitorella]|uniref:Uncharacterized protein n=1 Tax=Cirrhinus molitorella TaxID=172907 RepID=A0ABR3L858_9TELE